MSGKPLRFLKIGGIIRNAGIKPRHKTNVSLMEFLNQVRQQIPVFGKKIVDMMIL